MDSGFAEFPTVLEFGIMFGCQIQTSEIGGCRTRTGLMAFVHCPQCGASSVNPRHASSPLCDAQKNSLRRVWANAKRLVRPTPTPSARPLLWRHTDLPGGANPASAVSALWRSETRAPGVPGGQPALHQTLCPLRGATLPAGNHQGHCKRTGPGLGYRQDTADAVHESPVGQGWNARTQGDWHRRDICSQRSHLPHRGQRPDPQTPALVWRSGP